jgi:hypothetical protein
MSRAKYEKIFETTKTNNQPNAVSVGSKRWLCWQKVK